MGREHVGVMTQLISYVAISFWLKDTQACQILT